MYTYSAEIQRGCCKLGWTGGESLNPYVSTAKNDPLPYFREPDLLPV
jgi:hypothetical protein